MDLVNSRKPSHIAATHLHCLSCFTSSSTLHKDLKASLLVEPFVIGAPLPLRIFEFELELLQNVRDELMQLTEGDLAVNVSTPTPSFYA